jgi:hypothetical protein
MAAPPHPHALHRERNKAINDAVSKEAASTRPIWYFDSLIPLVFTGSPEPLSTPILAPVYYYWYPGR